MQDNEICHFVILSFPNALCIGNGQFYWHKHSEELRRWLWWYAKEEILLNMNYIVQTTGVMSPLKLVAAIWEEKSFVKRYVIKQ